MPCLSLLQRSLAGASSQWGDSSSYLAVTKLSHLAVTKLPPVGPYGLPKGLKIGFITSFNLKASLMNKILVLTLRHQAATYWALWVPKRDLKQVSRTSLNPLLIQKLI